MHHVVWETFRNQHHIQKNNHRFKMLILNVQNMTIECISKIKVKIFKISHAVTKLMTCSSEANALTKVHYAAIDIKIMKE